MNEIITELRVEDIHPNKKHYRTVTDKAVAALVQRIMLSHYIKPIVVLRDGDIFLIIEGHHRHAAAKELGMETLPAVVVDDYDEAQQAIWMVTSNYHVLETPIETSRGSQLMLTTGVPYEDAARAYDKTPEQMERVAAGVRLCGDYAEDMSLDRLFAVAEFEDDEEAAKRIMTCPEGEWERAYDKIKKERRLAVAVEAAKAIIEASGVELLGACVPGGMSYLGHDSSEAPEGATHAQMSVQEYMGTVAVYWYGKPADSTEDLEVAAAREKRDRRRAAFEAADARRLAFVRDHLTGKGPTTYGNELRDLAVQVWEDGGACIAKHLDDGPLSEITGLTPRIYAAILSSVGQRARFTLNTTDWYWQQRGRAETIAYFAALVAVGYELTDIETECLDVLTRDPEEADDE
ncbi:MAG: ParB/RepB/Spo0J family partition protein [Actinomycetota bacterium]|jgi:ParB/RepB/Spo0J family partition protein|nr:ParB/RepB/Spo0J family partition protein [Actinomycetota bacterium]